MPKVSGGMRGNSIDETGAGGAALDSKGSELSDSAEKKTQGCRGDDERINPIVWGGQKIPR